MTTYAVHVKAIDGWTRHSEHESYRDAVDQADMVHGRVVIAATGMTDEAAWKWAVRHQGFEGDLAAWESLDDDERQEYETGAQGIGTL